MTTLLVMILVLALIALPFILQGYVLFKGTKYIFSDQDKKEGATVDTVKARGAPSTVLAETADTETTNQKDDTAFEQFIQQHLGADQLAELNRKKDEYLNAKASIWTNGRFLKLLGVLLGLNALLYIFYGLSIIAIIITAWIIGLAKQYILKPQREAYLDQFKGVVQKVVTYFGENFAYHQKQHIPRTEVNESLIFPLVADELAGEDLVEGELEDTSFHFSEITADRVHEGTDQHGRPTRHNVRFFRGLFFVADFPRTIEGTTIMRPKDFSWRDAGAAFKGKLSSGYKVDGRLDEGHDQNQLEQIHLESEELEEVYNFYSTDQIEGRYVFTPALMERIKTLSQSWGQQVFMAFQGARLYLAVPVVNGLFEPPMDKMEDMDAKDAIKHVFRDMNSLIGIVEDLRLDRQIWKQQT
jgi:hypothetical protein